MSGQTKTQAYKRIEFWQQSLIDCIEDGVFVLDEDRCVKELNPAARLILGLSEAEIINHPLQELIPAISAFFEADRSHNPLRLVFNKSGWSRYYDIAITHLLKESGAKSAEYIAVLRDVTESEMSATEFLKWTLEIKQRNTNGRETEADDRFRNIFLSMVRHISAMCLADGTAIILWNDDPQDIHTYVTHGILTSYQGKPLEDILPLVFAHTSQNQGLQLEDVTTHNLKTEGIVAALPDESIIGIPLYAENLLLGVVITAYSLPHSITEEDKLRFEQSIKQVRLTLVQACLLNRLGQAIDRKLLELSSTNHELLADIAERTNREIELLAEHNFISGILDTLDALVIVIDRKGSVVRVNRACEQFFGYTGQEFSRKRVWDLLLQSQDNLTLKDMFANIQAGLSPFQYANHWKTKDGVQKMIAWSSSMLYDNLGNIQFIVAIGMDITERKNIEKLLERERLLFRGLIDSIPDLIFYKNRSGVYLDWNAAFGVFRKIKSKKGELTDSDLYPSDLAKRFMETDYQVIETGKAVTYENWTTNADGQRVLIETRKTPYYDADGEILGVIGVGRDITKHRNAENALRTANLEIEQLIDSLSSFIIVVTRGLCVTRWNARAQSVFGKSPEEVLGKHLTALNLPWEWNPVEVGIQQCEREFKPAYLDPIRFKREKKLEGYLGMNISPIFGGEHTLTGFILLGSDITERITLERRLTQAQRLESIGQLAAGIAHEINTPMQYIGDNTTFLQQNFSTILTALQEYKEILSASERGTLQPEFVQRVKENLQNMDLDYITTEVPLAISQTLEGIQHVVDIVQAMKGFSHPGTKQKTPVNINKALLETLTVSRNVWKYVATTETDFDPDLPEVACLPGEMNQVYLNLIVNAADAISDIFEDGSLGKGKINIKTRQDKDWIEIRISDTGTGIPEEIRTRIFEPFYTTKKVGKGSGQGLAIAYDIVEVKHGGTLTFETQLGVGTTFIIRLPIAYPDDPETESTEMYTSE